YIDAYIKDKNLIQRYHEEYIEMQKEIQNLNALEADKLRYEKEFELKQYHFKELESLNFHKNELEDLQEESHKLEHAEQLNDLSGKIAVELYESDNSIVDQLKNIKTALSKIIEIDGEQNDLKEELETSLINLRELGVSMASYRDNLVFNPQRLENVKHRLNEIYRLEKKHHKTFLEIFLYFQDLKIELKERQDYDTILEAKKKRLHELRENLAETTLQLSDLRKKTSKEFANRINSILRQMGMKYASFRASFRYIEGNKEIYIPYKNSFAQINDNGMDHIEFEIITNPGEQFKPLNLIVSGGELSRIITAVKSTLSASDATPTLIFDEADAGISGQIAREVGYQIQSLAHHHQVLCITHLPQIASLGQQHFKVIKKVEKNKSETTMFELKQTERVREIAELISAGKITDHSLRAAEELLYPE
ncbi:MAG: hypothetical protein KAI81_00810, partial [Candidatus Marinimicrobia bacterium]|nr:hypothetical protein [Candidatus Neomarinimicrobiota bacterium]